MLNLESLSKEIESYKLIIKKSRDISELENIKKELEKLLNKLKPYYSQKEYIKIYDEIEDVYIETRLKIDAIKEKSCGII